MKRKMNSKIQQQNRINFALNLMEILLTEDYLLASVEEQFNSLSSNQSSFVDAPHGPKSKVISSLDAIYEPFNTSFNPYSRTHGIKSLPETESIQKRKKTVLCVVSSLQALESSAKLLGSGFMMFVSSAMCPLLTHCGSPNLLVRWTARQAAGGIGNSLGMKGLDGLVRGTVLQFWYPLSRQLKAPQQYPFATQALQVCLY